jgi:hypothetical protein
MKTSHLFLAATLLVSGVVLGYWAGRHRRSDEARSTQAEFDSLRSDFRRLEDENRSLNGKLATVQDHRARSAEAPAGASASRFTPLEELRVLSDLQQRKLVRPALTIVDRKGQVDSSFVGLFALTTAGGSDYSERSTMCARS